MPEANELNTTSTMTVAVPAVVAGAAPMALASLPTSADQDPIFAAINAHREAVGNFNAAHERLAAEGIDGSNWQPSQEALMAEVAAAKALIGTAPTTRAGLRALEIHLREPDSRTALHFITRPLTLDGLHMGTVSGGPEGVDWLIAGVDWLIAQRAAEIVGAVG